MLVTNLGYDQYRGVTAIGRIHAGQMRVDMPLARIRVDGEILPESVRYLNIHEGLVQVAVDSAQAGDIVVLAGLEGIAIGETLTDPEHPQPLPPIQVEEPTVHMTFGVNASPFSGREGQWSTSRKLRQRLFDELRTNVALKVVEGDSQDSFRVSGMSTRI